MEDYIALIRAGYKLGLEGTKHDYASVFNNREKHRNLYCSILENIEHNFPHKNIHDIIDYAYDRFRVEKFDNLMNEQDKIAHERYLNPFDQQIEEFKLMKSKSNDITYVCRYARKPLTFNAGSVNAESPISEEIIEVL